MVDHQKQTRKNIRLIEDQVDKQKTSSLIAFELWRAYGISQRFTNKYLSEAL